MASRVLDLHAGQSLKLVMYFFTCPKTGAARRGKRREWLPFAERLRAERGQ